MMSSQLRKPRIFVPILAHGIEAIRRVFGFWLHPVQLQAVIAAIRGRSIEMQTGEGKTLVSAMIGYFYSYSGGVHLATTNAYLASRDYASIAPVYASLRIASGVIRHQQSPSSKREAYSADVTFGPGYQFGFDYLQDQTTLRDGDFGRLGVSTVQTFSDQSHSDLLVQQGGHCTLIVDEADSVMIDEALTPLVLGGTVSKQHDTRPYVLAWRIAQSLVDERDYVLGLGGQSVELTEDGIAKIHKDPSQIRRMELVRPWAKYVENALQAEHSLCRNEQYVVQDNAVKIVDQFTGRVFDDRQWQSGLHQAVCVKEHLPVQQPTEVLARISRQRYFQRYDRIIGLSGTLASVRKELQRVYGARVAVIPTNKKSQRDSLATRCFATVEAKIQAIADDVIIRNERGQPVLLGTRTIRQSEACAAELRSRGLQVSVLNGIQDEAEAEIVSQAGRSGSITIATNMAGRGTDIRLDDQAKLCGGLHVIGFEHNFSRRVDRQLIGRSARQGQPGSTQFYLSCEDDLFQDHPKLASRILRSCPKHARGGGEVTMPLQVAKVVHHVQEDHERKAAKSRQQIAETDAWLNIVRESLTKETV